MALCVQQDHKCSLQNPASPDTVSALWASEVVAPALQLGSTQCTDLIMLSLLAVLTWTTDSALTSMLWRDSGLGDWQNLSHLMTLIYREAWDCIKERNHSAELLLSFFHLLLWDRLLWTSAETRSSLWGKKVIFYHGALEIPIKEEK